MKNVWLYVQAHPAAFSVGAFYVWSAFIGSLPAPQPNSGQLYKFLFSFLNTLGANISRAYSSRLPAAVALAASPEAKAADAVDAKQAAAIKP